MLHRQSHLLLRHGQQSRLQFPISQLTGRLLLSLFAGLGISFALVYVLDLLDDRFRSPEEIKIQLGTPVLAMIRHLEELPGRGIEAIHTFAKPNSAQGWPAWGRPE